MTKEKTNKSAYEGDEFHPVQPTLPFMICKLSHLGNHLKNALDFSRKQEGFEVVSQKREEKNTKDEEKDKKRLIKKMKLEDVTGKSWYKQIAQEITDRIKQIHPDLEIDKFAILKSLAGCPQQWFHTDNKPSPHHKRYSIIFSLMEGTSMVFKEPNCPDDFEWSIGISPGTFVIFNDESRHAGAAYMDQNIRFFFTASVPKDKASPKATKTKRRRQKNILTSPSNKKPVDKIHFENQSKEYQWRCPGCNEIVYSSAQDGGRSTNKRHRNVCEEFHIKEGMTPEGAQKLVEKHTQRNRDNTARHRRNKKEEKEAKLEAEQMSKEKTEENAEESKEDKEGANKKRVRNEGGGNKVRQIGKKTKRKAE
ncbi:predicted protein [Chaetoceros tenuissimus]|uniref:Uncharacterized protein n=1 Tax=Chaetoceros tenuissimus TaxID=426638 RepID=A0AAD3HAW9_9STRA|nr:predicted protein [Chaetoceros tenuissimus]